MNTLPEKIHAEEIAPILGVTSRRLMQLAKEGYFPEPERGWYKFAELLAGFVKSREAKETPASERKLRAEASILERKDRREAGETMDAEQVFKAWENVTLIFRQRILRIGNNVQSKAGLNDAQRKSVDTECADACRELEKKLIYTAEQEESEDEK